MWHLCRRFEVPTPPAANSVRNFKSKSGTRVIELPLCFRSSCLGLLRRITNFGDGALARGLRASPAGSFDSQQGRPYKQRKLAAAGLRRPLAVIDQRDNRTQSSRMANTSSARKATRQIARRTIVNKSRRSRLRTAVVKIEEAIATGDRSRAQ